ncbi:hypothetical protein N9O63_00990 [Candidatus Pelagibacter sp.]|nr:hypothetical protein [Candidatus Pelagibacter sp.]
MIIVGFIFNIINDIKNILWNLIYNKKVNKEIKKQNISKNLIDFFTLYFQAKKNIDKYYKKNFINIRDLKKLKKSDVLFIFGSGHSLNKIKPGEWKKINNFDTLGFNNTIFLKKINFTFHINRETIDMSTKNLKIQTDQIGKNRFLKKTIIIFPKGVTATYTNKIFANKLFNFKNNFSFFYTNKISTFPNLGLDSGLIHKQGTLTDALSLGYYLNYKKIIIAGVDLYDRGYFFLKKKQTANIYGKPVVIDRDGKKHDDLHSTAENGIIDLIGEWSKFFKKKNINIYIFNKKSLLKKYLKVFKF